MVSQQDVDVEWASLADNDDEEAREAAMAARYTELAGLEEEERRARLKSMAKGEYSLPDEKLRPFTVSRMRTWLAMDQEKAALIAKSYDSVMLEMPAPIAMRRVALVQSLVLDFTVEEEERLRQLVPRVFAGAPSRLTGLARDEAQVPSLAALPPKKPWWAFWKKA